MEDVKTGQKVLPDMPKRKSELAAKYFKEGYNCAQSVLLAFLDDNEAGNNGLLKTLQGKIDRETALKLTSSFGGGMGRLREVCGAASAMFMLAGFLKGYSSPNDDTAKALHYELIQNLAAEFKKSHGTIICRELLGLAKQAQTSKAHLAENTGAAQGADENFSPIPSKRTEEYYAKRPCEAFIKTAAEITEKLCF